MHRVQYQEKRQKFTSSYILLSKQMQDYSHHKKIKRGGKLCGEKGLIREEFSCRRAAGKNKTKTRGNTVTTPIQETADPTYTETKSDGRGCTIGYLSQGKMMFFEIEAKVTV